MSDDGFTDSFTAVSEQGWLQRLFGSFIAALFGLALFLGSFVLLYWNEGHAVAEMMSLNTGARTVVSVSADTIDAAHDGQLVHVSGLTMVTDAAADPLFHIAPANAVRLRRHVESYQWSEHQETETEKHLGGSETKRTTYTYRKIWSDKPIKSAEFKQPNGHANPVMPLQSAVFDARMVQIGAFTLDGSAVDKLSTFKGLVPPSSATGAGVDPAFQRVGDQFYHGTSPQVPEIGDMQVSYEIVDAQPVSVVGAQIGHTLTQFRGKDGRVIEIVDQGTRSADDMFHEAKSEAATLTWILRGVGFVVMVIGLALLSAPLAWLASVVPLLSDLVDTAAIFLALVLAVPLTLITIAVAWMAHRPLIGGGLILAGLVAAVALRKLAPRRPPRKSAWVA